VLAAKHTSSTSSIVFSPPVSRGQHLFGVLFHVRFEPFTVDQPPCQIAVVAPRMRRCSCLQFKAHHRIDPVEDVKTCQAEYSHRCGRDHLTIYLKNKQKKISIDKKE
jgi:hypothetical protein